MRLERLFEDKWIIDGICGNMGNSHVSIFLNQLDTKYEAHADAMFAIYERVAQHGGIMNEGNSHLIAPSIFQLTQGRLRVPFFYGKERKQIILTHGFLKRSKTTPRKEINRVTNHRETYLKDYNSNNIVISTDME